MRRPWKVLAYGPTWLCPGARRGRLRVPSVELVPYVLSASVLNSCFPKKRIGDPKVDLEESGKGDPELAL